MAQVDNGMLAKERFLAQIDEKLKTLNGHTDAPFQALRVRGREALAQTAFPGRKDEDWKYTSVKPIISKEYSEPGAHSAPDLPKLPDSVNRLVVNGRANAPAITLDNQVFIGPISEAWARNEIRAALESVISEFKSADLGAFEALALGLTDEVEVIFVPDNISASEVVHYQYYTETLGKPIAVFPYTVVLVGRNASLEFAQSFHGGEDSKPYLMNSGLQVYCAQGARVSYYRLQADAADAYHIANLKVHQERDSLFGNYTAELGGAMLRNNIEAEHKGTNVGTDLYGVYLAGGRQHMDTQSFIDHAIPHCHSNELYKGLLAHYARGVFNGKIIVRPDAQKTNAFQQNAAMLLSPNAQMDSKPQLEIFADDVKCSHGATIGQMDEDALFYLRSRGLNKTQAQEMLQTAFLQEVLDTFPNKSIAGFFEHNIAAKQEELNSPDAK